MENENCDEELRIDDNAKRCDQQFMSSVEIASGELASSPA